MKQALRALFAPLLTRLESGDKPYNHKPINRKLLIVLGILFSGLSAGVVVVGMNAGNAGFVLPALVFGTVGVVALVVGGLGNDRAVARIWGNK